MIVTDCSHCGERIKADSKSGFCKYCKTPEQRIRQTEMNKVIRSENIAKGYHYSDEPKLPTLQAA